jgi:Spx/MgsR family transcriptional regulator
MKLYGIVNCETVRKARAWLDARAIAYTFVDMRRQPPDEARLAAWIGHCGWERLVNRRGTTWRSLPPEAQAQVRDAQSAIALMRERPTVIRRPVIELADRIIVGFEAPDYQRTFGANDPADRAGTA